MGSVKSDIEIARVAKMKLIKDVLEKLSMFLMNLLLIVL